MATIKLINEGSYGCIYRPGIGCNGKPQSNKYVTKIQNNKRAIQNESAISAKIRTIPGYTRFFAPILKECEVKMTKDTKEGLKQCQVFNKPNVTSDTRYVSTKIRYVGNMNLMKYLLSVMNKTPNKFLLKLKTNHLYLLNAVQKMLSKSIIHYDIKYNNVMFDPNLLVPIIIDFGLAFTNSKLNDPETNLETIFFVFDYYSWWPIDIVVCSFIIQEIGKMKAKTEYITQSQIDYILEVFIKGKKMDKINIVKNDVFKLRIINSDECIQKYANTYHSYFDRFVGQTWWSLYENLIQFSDTWDNYSFASTFLVIMDDAYNEHTNELETQVALNKEKYVNYTRILESIVYCSPDKRSKVKDCIKMIKKI
jgi:serine/threonine protein kinase